MSVMASSNLRACKTQPENMYHCLRVEEALEQLQLLSSIILTVVKNEAWGPEQQPCHGVS